MSAKMPEDTELGPDSATGRTESSRKAALDRQQRQAAALRANLKRRKEQQRGREAAKLPEEGR